MADETVYRLGGFIVDNAGDIAMLCVIIVLCGIVLNHFTKP